jgi:hypothetical protein
MRHAAMCPDALVHEHEYLKNEGDPSSSQARFIYLDLRTRGMYSKISQRFTLYAVLSTVGDRRIRVAYSKSSSPRLPNSSPRLRRTFGRERRRGHAVRCGKYLLKSKQISVWVSADEIFHRMYSQTRGTRVGDISAPQSPGKPGDVDGILDTVGEVTCSVGASVFRPRQDA